MKTYWDLTEQQRAALTRDEVAKFIDAELMLKGVLKAAPLMLLPETTPDLEMQTYYVIGGRYDALDVVFATSEAALACLALAPMLLVNDWSSGEMISHAKPLPTDAGVSTRVMPAPSSLAAVKVALKEAAAAKAENKRRMEAHEAATKATEDALAGLWEDWHECTAKAAAMGRVVDTFAEYVRLADGDQATASRFLHKVFAAEQIAAAEEWTGTTMHHDVAAAE